MLGHNRSASIVIAALGLAACSIARVARADAPVDAIWHQQSFEFAFTGSNNIVYSCAGLSFKLVSILKAVGVQDATEMQCLGGGVSRSIQVRLRTQSAVEATDENIRAATQFDAKARLLARLNQEQLPSAADVPRFIARWQRVDLHGQRKLRLDPGDCELLQQVRKQIFPKLSIRVERDGLNCRPGIATRFGPRLRVVALLPQADQITVPGARAGES